MNKRFTTLLLVFIAGAFFLSSCGTPVSASGWPGVSTAKDAVYLSDAGSVFSIRLSDGTMTWRFPAKPENGKNFYAAPVASGDQVVVGDYAGNLYGLDAATGTQKWTFADGNRHWIASPLVVNDTILAPSAGNNLYALDLSGKLRWKFSAKYANWAQPVSDGKVVYFSSMDHSLYALNIADGSKIWATDMGGAIVNSPVLGSDGSLYVGTLGNEVLAVNSANGKILWKFNATSGVWSTPALDGDNVYFGTLGGTIYSVNAQSGRQVWKLDAGGSITGNGVVYPDGLIFATENGNVIGVSVTGQKQWTKTLTGTINSSPAVAADSVILATIGADKVLVAIDFKGNEKWSFALPK